MEKLFRRTAMHEAASHGVKVEDLNLEVCPSCRKNSATESHLCPFQQEVHGDNEYMCTYCEECEQECARNI